MALACTGPKGDPGDPGVKGDKGDPGDPGVAGGDCTVTDDGAGTKTITCDDGTTVTVTDGTNGLPGDPATDTGTISGTVTSSVGGVADGVAVATVPATVAATTDASGNYALADVPIGMYKLVFTHADYAVKEVVNLAVTAGGVIDADVTLDRTNPLIATGSTILQAGFANPVTLGVNVTGATGALTYTWTQTAGPTTVTLAGATTAAPTFTTATLAAIETAGNVRHLELPPRGGLVPITSQQVTDMTYKFSVAVSDGTFTTTATTSVVLAEVQAGLRSFPRGLTAIANDAEAASYSWTLAAPPTSTATLAAATTRNPWFIPDLEGTYTLTNSAADPDTVVTVLAGDWVGVETTGGCKLCHNGGPGGSQYTPWKTTGHSAMLENGLEGALASYYGAGCIRCHTVGYDAATDNGGFDDVMATTGWTFPALGPTAFDTMPTSLKALAGIQCENCHGAGSNHAGTADTIAVSYDAATCGQCHDALSHHDRYELWAESGHANLELALDDATTEARGTSAAHCGRCHGAQGFVRWSEQLLAGNPGNITKPDGTAADLAYLNDLGLNKAKIQPQTCQVCHDPHSLELRIPEDAQVALPSGFTVAGLGAGMVCISCHNSRNGAKGDAITNTAFSAPHMACQGDVFMGKNAYFVSGLYISRHSAAEDTCVTCHMTIIPESVEAESTNHTFRADRSICADCHSEGVTGEATSVAVEMYMHGIELSMSEGLRRLLDQRLDLGLNYAVRAWNPATDGYSSAASGTSNVVLAALPVSVELEEVHGQISLKLNMPAAVAITYTDGSTTNNTEVWLQIGTLKDATAGTTLLSANSDTIKALWNYFLIHGDGTEGIHNPTFTFDVLSASQTKMDAWVASLPAVTP